MVDFVGGFYADGFAVKANAYVHRSKSGKNKNDEKMIKNLKIVGGKFQILAIKVLIHSITQRYKIKNQAKFNDARAAFMFASQAREQVNIPFGSIRTVSSEIKKENCHLSREFD